MSTTLVSILTAHDWHHTDLAALVADPELNMPTEGELDDALAAGLAHEPQDWAAAARARLEQLGRPVAARMGRPTSAPRLADLSPAEVAAEVVELVVGHVHRLAFGLGPGRSVEVRGDGADSTTLGLTVEDLVRYAQRGDLGDWPDESCAEDALVPVCGALYSQAGRPGTFGLGEAEEEADVESSVGVVLSAAIARWQLSRGEAISSTGLAALAGLSVQAVRRADDLAPVTRGARPLRYAAEEARRWLGARGVVGLG